MSYLTSPDYPKIHWRISSICPYYGSYSYDEVHCSVSESEFTDVFMGRSYEEIREIVTKARWRVGDVPIKMLDFLGEIHSEISPEEISIVFYIRKNERIL